MTGELFHGLGAALQNAPTPKCFAVVAVVVVVVAVVVVSFVDMGMQRRDWVEDRR